MWHRTVRCSKTTDDPNGQLPRTLTDRLTWRAPDSAQSLSGGVPDCPVRPIASSLGQRLQVVGGYKYPQPPHPLASKHSEHCIQYKSKRLHSKTHSIDQILSKPPNQLNSIRDLREGVLCSFVALVAWFGLFLFPFLFSSAL
jgi:hypothetical protein